MRDVAVSVAVKRGLKIAAGQRSSWWARLGSNQRPPACKAGALPLSYAPDVQDLAPVRRLPTCHERQPDHGALHATGTSDPVCPGRPG